MPNPYVNKVVQSNGTTLIDISDTTAVASDVASGKYFYLATGEKVEGTASGGGDEPSGPTYETIIPLQTINCTVSLSNNAYGGYINPYTSFTEEGEKYRVIFDGATYEPLTATYYGSGTSYLYVGDINVEASSSATLAYPFEILLYNGQTFYLGVKGSGSHMLQVDKITSEGSGGSATLITKTITANGTYSAEDDDADGYSEVTVNVAGGASNIVTGTFKGTTTGAAMDVTLNYSGSGYPIAVMIYPSNANESTFQSTIQRYAVRDYMLEKNAKATSPTYSKTGNGDSATFTARYKNSSSNSASYTNGGSLAALYADEAAGDAFNTIVKIRSKTKMSVFIASSSYGFMANIEYSYVVIYSS